MSGIDKDATDPLESFVERALDRPVPPEIGRLARAIADRPGVAAVLFYGNRLRDQNSQGLADLYVLTDHDRAWSGAGPAAAGNRLLPPNVYHLRAEAGAPHPPSPPSPGAAGRSAPTREDAPVEPGRDGRPAESGNGASNLPCSSSLGLTGRSVVARGDAQSKPGHDARPPANGDGAKVAVMRLAAFRHRMRRESWDTTLWARFAQPAALLYARDDAARAAVAGAIATGWRTAAWWADRLSDGPDRWAGLFAQTYRAELRPEGAARSGSITASSPELYAEIDRLLPPEAPSTEERAAALQDWRRRQRVGRALNAARLAKAAMTFRGGTAYALGKIERHGGPEALSPWEKRLPWLAPPLVLLRLLRRGGLR